MMTGSLPSLRASSAAFGWMQAANSRIGMLSCCGQPSFKGNRDKDTNLQLDMLNDSFQYQAYMTMADSMDRVKKDNIRRSFSVFA